MFEYELKNNASFEGDDFFAGRELMQINFNTIVHHGRDFIMLIFQQSHIIIKTNINYFYLK